MLYWLFGAEGAVGEGAGVGAPVEGAGGCEGAGVGVGACCWVEVFSFTVLHLFFSAFHWHVLSATQDASSVWERQGSVGLQPTNAIVSPEIAKAYFIGSSPLGGLN
jgi:hypothetical protein